LVNLKFTDTGKIYFAGGFSSAGPSAKIDIYDNATNSWSPSFLNDERFNMAAVTVDNKIYWAGGLELLYFCYLLRLAIR